MYGLRITNEGKVKSTSRKNWRVAASLASLSNVKGGLLGRSVLQTWRYVIVLGFILRASVIQVTVINRRQELN